MSWFNGIRSVDDMWSLDEWMTWYRWITCDEWMNDMWSPTHITEETAKPQGHAFIHSSPIIHSLMTGHPLISCHSLIQWSHVIHWSHVTESSHSFTHPLITVRDRVPCKTKRLLIKSEQKFEENDVKLDVKNQLRIWWGCFVGNTRFSKENGPPTMKQRSRQHGNDIEISSKSKRILKKIEAIFDEKRLDIL